MNGVAESQCCINASGLHGHIETKTRQETRQLDKPFLHYTMPALLQASATFAQATATFTATAATCTTAIPDENGYVPPNACNANYGFYPRWEDNTAFAIAFFMTTTAHVVQAFILKKVSDVSVEQQ